MVDLIERGSYPGVKHDAATKQVLHAQITERLRVRACRNASEAKVGRNDRRLAKRDIGAQVLFGQNASDAGGVRGCALGASVDRQIRGQLVRRIDVKLKFRLRFTRRINGSGRHDRDARRESKALRLGNP